MSSPITIFLDGIPVLDSTPENAHPVEYEKGNTKYSREDYIGRRNGLLYGAWESTSNGACMEAIPERSSIEEKMILTLEDMGPCANSKHVIKATMK
jgi:hypothetical protein